MSLIINYRDCDVIIPKTASSSQNRLRVKLAKSTKSIIPHACIRRTPPTSLSIGFHGSSPLVTHSL